MAVKILTRRSGLDLFISFKTVNRQPSNGLKISRQPSKKVIFFTVNRRKWRLRLTVKWFQGISSLTISGIYPGSQLLKNLLTGRTSSHVLKNTFSRHCKTLKNLLISQHISKFIPKLIFTVSFGLNFHLITVNYKLRNLTVSRQN